MGKGLWQIQKDTRSEGIDRQHHIVTAINHCPCTTEVLEGSNQICCYEALADQEAGQEAQGLDQGGLVLDDVF
jgi:hypothetical protein